MRLSSWDYGTYHTGDQRLWYLSHRRPANAQASLRIHAVSPEPLLFAHMKYGSRQQVLQKIRHLAPLVVWAHTLDFFAVNRIPTSGSQQVWPVVIFTDLHMRVRSYGGPKYHNPMKWLKWFFLVCSIQMGNELTAGLTEGLSPFQQLSDDLSWNWNIGLSFLKRKQKYKEYGLF